jgi:YVTN family beta-propeller protein
VQISISKIEKGYHIYLIIIIAVVIYTSVIVLPYNAVGKTLYDVEFESNSIVQNVPSFNVGEYPTSIAVNEADNTAYVANSGSNTVSVIDGDTMKVSDITVGEYPTSIAVNEADNTAYVANRFSDTVSVIKGTNGVYSNIANVTVGEFPTSIAVNMYDNTAFVANRDSNTVSVIKETNGVYSNIANVTVGEYPTSIAAEMFLSDEGVVNRMFLSDEGVVNIVFVGHGFSDTVSVIKGTNGVYSNIANVTVGEFPTSIAVNEVDNTAYVANSESNTVSVIYGPSQKVQAGVSFDINPFHAGHIECNNIIVPTNQYLYVDFRTRCLAQHNKDFQFSSWSENLGRDSSRTIKASQGDWFTNTLDWLMSAFSSERKDTPATLTVTKFGSFTANFEKLPPAIPPEYLATLFTVIVTALVGSWLTPTIIGWRKAKKQGRKLDYYHQEVRNLYSDGKLDKNDISKLDILKNDIAHAYSRGKINNEQYGELMKDISIRYEEIFKKEIDSLNDGKNKNIDESRLYDLRKSIEDAHLKGKMNQQHYANLVNNISMLYQEVFKKEIDSLNSLSNNEDKMKLLNKMHSDIEDAYSKEKVTEKHYNLLKEKISDYKKSHSINIS